MNISEVNRIYDNKLLKNFHNSYKKQKKRSGDLKGSDPQPYSKNPAVDKMFS